MPEITTLADALGEKPPKGVREGWAEKRVKARSKASLKNEGRFDWPNTPRVLKGAH
jgi:hypothetical protein